MGFTNPAFALMHRVVEVEVDGNWLEATLTQVDRDLDGLKNGRICWWGPVRYYGPHDAPFCRRAGLV